MNEERKAPKTLRERLEDQRWILENSYGNGSFVDGLVRQRIEQIDALLGAH